MAGPPHDPEALYLALIEAANSPDAADNMVNKHDCASNGNSREPKPSKPTNISGLEFWD